MANQKKNYHFCKDYYLKLANNHSNNHLHKSKHNFQLTANTIQQQMTYGITLHYSDQRIYLTPREVQIIYHYLQGHTHRQCAQALYLSERSIERYAAKIRHKLRCRCKKEVIRIVMSSYLSD